jgi:hypothetical protein
MAEFFLFLCLFSDYYCQPKEVLIKNDVAFELQVDN